MTRIAAPVLFSCGTSSLNTTPLALDALQTQFATEALHSTNILAMTAGGLAGRLAKTLSLSALSALPSLVRLPLSSVSSLFCEVAVFRGVHHSFHLTDEAYWSKQGFTREALSFGALRGVATLLHGTNAFTLHVSQNLGMMLGEELGGHFGVIEKSQANFAERFVQASAKNFALGAGTVFSRFLGGSHLNAIERNLDRQSLFSSLSHQVPSAVPNLQMATVRTHMEPGVERLFLAQWVRELREEHTKRQAVDPELPELVRDALTDLEILGLSIISSITQNMRKGANENPIIIYDPQRFIAIIDDAGHLAYNRLKRDFEGEFKSLPGKEQNRYREMSLRVYELHAIVTFHLRQAQIDRETIWFDNISYSAANQRIRDLELRLIKQARSHYGCAPYSQSSEAGNAPDSDRPNNPPPSPPAETSTFSLVDFLRRWGMWGQ